MKAMATHIDLLPSDTSHSVQNANKHAGRKTRGVLPKQALPASGPLLQPRPEKVRQPSAYKLRLLVRSQAP